MADRPPLIELRHLRYFLAAAEHGSFRKAGAALGVQESAISRRIRDFEDRLGASLFQRYNGGVRLTVAGERFRNHARTILGQVSEGLVEVSAIGCGAAGRIRVGVVPSIATGFLADLLRDFSRRHGDVHIELIDGAQTEHIAAVRRFDLDIAFVMGTKAWFGCDTVALWSERLFVILPEDHPMSGKAELAWVDLANETFIVVDTALGLELQALLTARLADLGHFPVLQRQNVGCDSLLPLVALGRGLTLTTEVMAVERHPSVVHRPIASETLQFTAVWSPSNDNPALRRFMSMAKMHFARSSRSNAPVD